MVTTKQKSRAETYNIKKGETERKIIENHHTKIADRSTRKKQRYRVTRRQKKKIAVVSPHISIITISVGGLNSPITRHGVVAWIKKTDP